MEQTDFAKSKNIAPSFYRTMIRRLIVLLTISGVFNILLASLLFYLYVKETPPKQYFEQKPALKEEAQTPLAVTAGNAELVHYFRSLSFAQLVEKLSNKQLIENGYTQRDIALACLIAFHQFDMPRALLGLPQPEQKRIISYGLLKSGKPATITVYPALTDMQFDAIKEFVAQEKWPLTAKGLFWQLKKYKDFTDTALIDSFFMTEEYVAVELLLNRADVAASKQEVLKLLLEGPWNLLTQFQSQQKVALDLSLPRLQRFLLDYIDHKSTQAAYLFIKIDREFALKKLDDKYVVTILQLLQEKTEESEQYAVELLKSPRSDVVWKTAAALLYSYAEEAIPEKNIHHMAMKRFIPGNSQLIVESQSEPIKAPLIQSKKIENLSENLKNSSFKTENVITKPTTPKKSAVAKVAANGSKLNVLSQRKDRHHIVQEGDTLWKVSRVYNVHIDALRSYNRLKNDALKPGTELRIP